MKSMRIFVSVLLFAALLLPTRATAAACLDENPSPPGLGVVREALDILLYIYVEPIPSSVLLGSANDALIAAAPPGTRQILELPSYGGVVDDDWGAFSEQYCLAWYGPDPTSPDIEHTAYTSIRAMVNAVNEAHTNFMTPQMYEQYLQWSSGETRYEGIGARLRSDPLTIIYVFPGSPAEEAGLQPGDQIVEIDGQTVRDMNASDAAGLVRGEAGTAVHLKIQREPDLRLLEFTVVRASVRVPSVDARVIDDIGYLRIQDFPVPAVYQEVLGELNRFTGLGVRGMVLDLRGNTGGRVDVGTRVASLFLSDGTPIYQQTTRRGRTTTRAAANDAITWDRPIVVLVDGGTASMAEILAASLQEQGIARLVGETTSGVVAGAIVVPLSDGGAVQVTTIRIDSGLGRILNTIGVAPDIEVEGPLFLGQPGADPGLDTGLALLRAEIAARGEAATATAP